MKLKKSNLVFSNVILQFFLLQDGRINNIHSFQGLVTLEQSQFETWDTSPQKRGCKKEFLLKSLDFLNLFSIYMSLYIYIYMFILLITVDS